MKRMISSFLIFLAFLWISSISFAKSLNHPNSVSFSQKRLLDKITFIHFKKGYAKPFWAKGGRKGGECCYEFIGKWVRWKETASYVINPKNSGLSESFIAQAIFYAAEEWDRYTTFELFSDTYSIDYSAVPGKLDGKNTFGWGDYPTEGVIAVTTVWGYFSGPPWSRRIVEFDVMFDTDYDWGDALEDSGVMDLQNIATHEIGHGAGMDDLYDPACSEETMYGYSDYGETKKRDLYCGDIEGIQSLYGIE